MNAQAVYSKCSLVQNKCLIRGIKHIKISVLMSYSEKCVYSKTLFFMNNLSVVQLRGMIQFIKDWVLNLLGGVSSERHLRIAH